MQLEECTFENTPEFNIGTLINAKVLSCYDGDTFTIAVMLQQNAYKFTCRLMGCDTPEMKISSTKSKEEKELQKQKAVTAKKELLLFITNCNLESCNTNKEIDNILKFNSKIIQLDVFGFDKYGRLLVNYKIENEMLSDHMIKGGYAYAYTGGKKQTN
jgi:endonuclease YncB( thermonuclease family)